jgi:hypothetical protein
MKAKTIIISIIFIILISILVNVYIVKSTGVKKLIEPFYNMYNDSKEIIELTKEYKEERDNINMKNNNPTLKELRDNLEYYLKKEITIEGLAEPNMWCSTIDVCMLKTDYLTSEDKITVPSSKIVIPIKTIDEYGLTLFKHWRCSGSLNKLDDYYYFNAIYCECLTC